MAYSLQQIADFIQTNSDFEVTVKGDAAHQIDSLAALDKAAPNQITFLNNPKYKKLLADCNAGAVILPESEAQEWNGHALIMQDPYVGFAYAAQLLDTTPKQKKLIHPSAVVSETATVADDVAIGANAVIEDDAVLGSGVEIGAGCFVGQGTIVNAGSKLWPNVTLYHGVTLGERCIVHSSTVIGADGFGYAPYKKEGDSHWIKIPQLGGVVIGDDTEIGASVAIDRGALEDTIIGKGVKLDNLIHLAHNVQIGDYTAIAAGCKMAGSTKVGKNVTMGGVCAINGHITIADNVHLTGRTLVMKDIKEAGVYSSGMPASPNKEWRKNTVRYGKLTELFDRVKKLESKLD